MNLFEDLIKINVLRSKITFQRPSSFECIIYIHMSGDYSKEVTPVPMPNTEVKLLSVMVVELTFR